MATELLTFAETTLNVNVPPPPPMVTEIVRYISSWQEGFSKSYDRFGKEYRIPFVEKHPLNAAFIDNGLYLEFMRWDDSANTWYPVKEVTPQSRRYGRVVAAKKGNYVLEYSIDTPVDYREWDTFKENFIRVPESNGYLGAPLAVWVPVKDWVESEDYRVSRGYETVVRVYTDSMARCILPHISTQENRPEQDLADGIDGRGVYWELVPGKCTEHYVDGKRVLEGGAFVPLIVSDLTKTAKDKDGNDVETLVDGRNVLRREIEVYEPNWVEKIVPPYFLDFPIFKQTIERYNDLYWELNYRTDWVRLGLEDRMIPCERYVSTWIMPVGEIQSVDTEDEDFLIVTGYSFRQGQQVSLDGSPLRLVVFEVKDADRVWSEKGRRLERDSKGNWIYGYDKGDIISYLDKTYKCEKKHIINSNRLSKIKNILPDQEVKDGEDVYWEEACVIRLASYVEKDYKRSFDFKVWEGIGEGIKSLADLEGIKIFETRPQVDSQGYIFDFDWTKTSFNLSVNLQTLSTVIDLNGTTIVNWTSRNASSVTLIIRYPNGVTETRLVQANAPGSHHIDSSGMPPNSIIRVELVGRSQLLDEIQTRSVEIRIRNYFQLFFYYENKNTGTLSTIWEDREPIMISEGGVVEESIIPQNKVDFPEENELGQRLQKCHVFAGWKAENSETNVPIPSINFWRSVWENRNYIAVFEKLRHYLTTQVSPVNSGTIEGTTNKLGVYEYDCGTDFTLYAKRGCGYKFVGWEYSEKIIPTFDDNDETKIMFTLEDDTDVQWKQGEQWVKAVFEENFDFDVVEEVGGDWSEVEDRYDTNLQCGPAKVDETGNRNIHIEELGD